MSGTGKTSTFYAAANLAKLCIGVGVLALPFSVQKGGLLFAPLLIGVVAGWNMVACSMMIECKEATRTRAFPTDLSSSYSKIAYAGAGRPCVLITDMCIVITLLGVCIAYQITFAQLLQQIPWTDFSTEALSIISGIIVFPVSCVQNVGALASFSMVGLICLVVSTVAILTYGFIYYGDDVFSLHDTSTDQSLIHDSNLPLWPVKLADLTTFVGVSVFCFGLCSLAFPVEESMQHRHEFSKAVLWSVIFVWLMYTLLGDVGAILYNHSTYGIRDNILGNLPTDSAVALLVRIAMCGVSLLTYPLTLVPPAQMVEHYLASKIPVLGTGSYRYSRQSSIVSSHDNDRYTYGSVHQDEERQEQQQVAQHTQQDQPDDTDNASLKTRILNRFIMVCLTTIIATCIPCFGMVISLLGGFTVTILSFILPSYLHMQICGRDSSGSIIPDIYYKDLALTIAGVLICIIATAVTTLDFAAKIQSGAACA